MKDKIIKTAIIITTIILIIAIFIPQSLAISPGDLTGETSGDTEIDTDFVEKIVNMLRLFGTFIAVGALMIIGIKYMAGSIEEKATYKKTMLPYLIGCILLFGASTIAPQILEIFKEKTGSEEIGSVVLGLIQTVGSFVAVGVIMILGIKYMIGSTEERASYKKSMLPYVIGSILLFAAVNITGIIYESLGLDEEGYTPGTDSSSSISEATKYIGNHSVDEIRNKLKEVQAKIVELNKSENVDQEELNYYRTYSATLSEYLKWQN